MSCGVNSQGKQCNSNSSQQSIFQYFSKHPSVVTGDKNQDNSVVTCDKNQDNSLTGSEFMHNVTDGTEFVAQDTASVSSPGEAGEAHDHGCHFHCSNTSLPTTGLDRNESDGVHLRLNDQDRAPDSNLLFGDEIKVDKGKDTLRAYFQNVNSIHSTRLEKWLDICVIIKRMNVDLLNFQRSTLIPLIWGLRKKWYRLPSGLELMPKPIWSTPRWTSELGHSKGEPALQLLGNKFQECWR